jgi:hypothetical protein
MKGVPSMILSQSKAPSSPARSSSHKKFGDKKQFREAQKWAVDLTAQQINLLMQKIYRKQDQKKKDRTPNQFQQQITTINKYLTSFSYKLNSSSSSSSCDSCCCFLSSATHASSHLSPSLYKKIPPRKACCSWLWRTKDLREREREREREKRERENTNRFTLITCLIAALIAALIPVISIFFCHQNW